MRYGARGLTLFLAVLLAGCHSGQVRVPVSDAAGAPMVWRGKLDSDVFAKKTKSLRLSLDAGFLMAARVGPGVEFRRTVEQKWNENVETVNVMYKGLCNDWNAGLLSVERFNRKRDEIDKLYEVLAKEKPGFQDAFYEYWKKQSDLAFAELDKELKGKEEGEASKLQVEIEKKLDTIDSRFEAQRSSIAR